MSKLKGVLVLCLLMGILAACSTSKDNTEPATDTTTETPAESGEETDGQQTAEDSADTEEDSAISVDEGLMMVDITFQEEWFSGMSEEEIREDAAEYGVTDVTLNEDGTVTYRMTKQKRQEMLDEFKQSILEGIEEMLDGEDEVLSFTDITFNDDMTEFNIYVDSDLYSPWDSFASLAFYMYGISYQLIDGVEEPVTVVNIIDQETGDIIDTQDSSAMDAGDMFYGGETDWYEYDGEAQFDEVVVVDNDLAKVSFVEFDPHGDWGATFTVLLENKSDIYLSYQLNNVAVNGYMADPFWSDSVAPGKKAYSDISWYSDDFSVNGVNYIELVEGLLAISDADDWSGDNLYETEVSLTVANTGASVEATEALVFDNGYEEVDLYNDGQVIVTVKDFNPQGLWGATYTLFVENMTDLNLTFSLDYMTVNDFMIDPYWSEEVAAGKKVYSTMSWYEEDLASMGINYIDTVDGWLQIALTDDWSADYLVQEEIVLDGDPDGVGEPVSDVTYDNGFDEVTLVDNDQVTIIAKDYNPSGDWGPTMTLYLENKTDTNLYYSAEEVSINDFMADPYWSYSIESGKKAYSEMSWSESDLEENRIDSIEEIEFILYVYDTNDWEAPYLVDEVFVIEVE